MAVAKESVQPETERKRDRFRVFMSSDHAWLLRRPLSPRRPPPIIKTPPAPRRPGAPMDSLLQDQGETGMRGSSRQEADSPTPRAAPPTPLLPNTSTSTSTTGGFPCKPACTCYKNPLLTLLQSDTRFSAPPPIFCLSDFLQSRTGYQENFQSPPV